MTNQAFDVVIIGGGVVGSAIAYFLTARADFTGRVAVVERDQTYEFASAPRSLGGVRQQFTTPENIKISQFTAEFLAEVGDLLEVDGDRPDVGFKKQGYLFLGTAEMEASMRRIHDIQRRENAPVALLDATAIAAKFPWLTLDGITLGSYGTANEGWIDPFALLQAFRRKARAQGATYFDDEAVAIDRDGARVTAVRLKGGDILSAGKIVNAAGFRAGRVAAMAGIDLPVQPRKRSVFVVDIKEQIPNHPLLIDSSGVYWRPEGQYFICGTSPEEENDPEPDYDDFEVDHEIFENEIWPVMAARCPKFEALKVVNSWAGMYDMNLFDHNAVIGPHPDVTNLYFANGFSGHGLQQSPAVGRAVAELIAAGKFETLDLAAFRFDRIAAGEKFLEEAVV